MLIVLCLLLLRFTFASYVSQSSLTFVGRFTTPSATLNNFVANFNKTFFFGKSGPIPWWNPAGLNDFSFTTTLLSSAAPLGCAAGAPLALSHSFLVDIDPDQQFVSAVFGGVWRSPLFNSTSVRLAAPAPTLTRQWTQSVKPRPNPPPIAALTAQRAAVLVLSLANAQFAPALVACSPALQAWAGASNAALRLSLNNFDNDPNSATFASGDVVISMGPAGDDTLFVEPARVAGVTEAPSLGPSVPFEVAGGELALDLAVSVPTATPGGPSQLSQLRVGVRRVGTGGVTWLSNGLIATDARTLRHSGGVARIALTPAETSLLRGRPLVIADASGAVLLSERSDGRVVRAQPRVVRLLDSVAAVPIQVRTWQFGVPSGSSAVAVQSVPSPMPRRADRINGVPAGVVAFAGAIQTNRSGVAVPTLSMTRAFNASELPAPRVPLRSQMYFLELQTAPLVPNDTCARELLSVRAWSELPPPVNGANASLVWSDVSFLFEPYSWLYPSMAQFADMSSQAGVAASGAMIASTMLASFLDARFMPVTRDLDTAAQQRMVLFAQQQTNKKR
jgi:hypothetical protein